MLLAASAALLPGAANDELDESFRTDVQPLLANYCAKCHGEDLRTSGIAFSDYPDHAAVVRSRTVWERVLRVLRENEMPPVGPQPTATERQRMVNWVDDAINHLDWSEFRRAGSVTIPRLNRIEYNNTIRDLTGLDLRPADAFPEDGQGESGFRNDRDGLFMSPMLAEKYMTASNQVVDALIETRQSKDNLSVRLEIEDFLRTETNHAYTEYGLDLRNYQQTVYRYISFPKFGRYRFRVKAWGQSPVEGAVPGVTVRVAGKIVGQAHVIGTKESPDVLVFDGDVRAGSHRVSLHWFRARSAETSELNSRLAAEAKRRREEAKAAGKKPPGPGPVLLSLDWLEIRENPRPSEDGSLVWIAEPVGRTSAREAAQRILVNFATHAYRRPARKSDVRRLMEMYDKAARRGDSFEEAVGLALRTALVSPRFLYRPEQGGDADSDRALDPYELASRLSYFLWMSMPDEELLEAAHDGSLSEPETLRAHARRLLADPRSKASMETFFGQWLGFAELGGTIKPDDVAFPEFTPALGEAMLAEASHFFDDLVRTDGSLLNLLDADYSFLNEDLARHYGIKGVFGRHLRRVDLNDRRRGGVLGMGAVLTATSLPTRTSPVVRGKWVLETMLGEELPPPLPDAGELPVQGGTAEGMTLRRMFELHRDEQRCAVCHERIDPIGFGLENFDAIGRWRKEDNGQPVDASGTLPSGERFTGPAELKEILLGRQESFAQMITAQMLKFALGRDLAYFDQPTVEEISKSVVESGFSPATLILGVVDSLPFRFRGAMEEPEGESGP